MSRPHPTVPVLVLCLLAPAAGATGALKVAPADGVSPSGLPGGTLVAGQGLPQGFRLLDFAGDAQYHLVRLGRGLVQRQALPGRGRVAEFTLQGREALVRIEAWDPRAPGAAALAAVQERPVKVRGAWRFAGAPLDAEGKASAGLAAQPLGEPCGVVCLGGEAGKETWLVADPGRHQVLELAADGTVLQTWGQADQSGYRVGAPAEVRLADPTWLAVPTGKAAGDAVAVVADTANHAILVLRRNGGADLLAGTPEHEGWVDSAPGRPAAFRRPRGLAYDREGNLYVADEGNRRVRRIDPAGTVTTVAGTGAEGAQDGPGLEATFTELRGLAVDGRGWIWVVDRCGLRALKPVEAFQVTTVVGPVDRPGNGLASDYLGASWAAAVEPDRARRALRLRAAGLLADPQGIAVHGLRLFIADRNSVCEFDPIHGSLHRVVGGLEPVDQGRNQEGLLRDGILGEERRECLPDGFGGLARPRGVAASKSGDLLVSSGDALMAVGRAEGLAGPRELFPLEVEAEVLAGADSAPVLRVRVAADDRLAPLFTAASPLGLFWVGIHAGPGPVTYVHPERLLTLEDLARAAFPLPAGAASGQVIVCYFHSAGFALHGRGSWTAPAPAPILMGDLRRRAQPAGISMHLDEGLVVPLGAHGTLRWNSGADAPRQLLAYRRGGDFQSGGALRGKEVSGGAWGPRTWAPALREFRLDAFRPEAGGWVRERTFHKVRRRGGAPFARIEGQGRGVVAVPQAWAGERPAWLVADPQRHVVREVFRDDGSTGRVWGVPDSPGQETGAGVARLNRPTWLAAWQDRETGAAWVVVSDTDNHVIRRLLPEGGAPVLAGEMGREGWRDSGPDAPARFSRPQGLAFDSRGALVVADQGNCRLRKIAPGGAVTTLAGTGARGAKDGPAREATFTRLKAVAIGRHDEVYCTDGHGVRELNLANRVATVAGRVADAGCAPAGGAFADTAGPCLDDPQGLAFDGQALLVVDSGNTCVRLLNLDRREFQILAGDDRVPENRVGSLRDDLPGPLPASAAALAAPVGIGVDPDRDLMVTSGSDLMELARAVGFLQPAPGAPLSFRLASGGPPVLDLDDPTPRPLGLPLRVEWDRSAPSMLHPDGLPGLQGARFWVEAILPDGTLESLAGGKLPDEPGPLTIPVTCSTRGPRVIRLRVQTAQGVVLSGLRSWGADPSPAGSVEKKVRAEWVEGID